MYNVYQSPLSERYASQEMLQIFSPQFKYSTWRKLWVALAESEKETGLNISYEQLDELSRFTDSIDFNKAADYERKFQHDVMAHLHAFGEQCPLAKPILHLGATSCFITDNADLIQVREALSLLIFKLKQVIHTLTLFAKKYDSLGCLSYTHFQPAQLTTVGKRACLWIQDFLLDLRELIYRKDNLYFLGVKGATGTQASFLKLFKGNSEKVLALEKLVAEKMGFSKVFSISGQTYTRKQDMFILQAVAGIGASAHKFGSDIRLLSHLGEVRESFRETQIGSSAMPYKRNPILSERICSLSRFLLSLSENPGYTAATQWLERSLDDSANRRLTLPEAFLTADAILDLTNQIASQLVVHPRIIERNIERELPFIATENILMHCVSQGGDRQLLHEKIRLHSLSAREKVEEGHENDLLQRILDDPSFKLNSTQLKELLRVEEFTGRASQQVEEFTEEVGSWISM